MRRPLALRRGARTLFAVAIIVTGAALAIGCEQVVETDAVRVFDRPGQPENTWGYDPKQIRVARGTAVTFTNSGAVFHTVTSDDPGRPFDIGADPGRGVDPGQQISITFDQPVDPGESITVTFGRPGTFRYHCGVHPDMKGVVHVCDGACR